VGGSTSIDYGATSGGKSAAASSIKALEESLARRELPGNVEGGLFPGSYRPRPRIPEGTRVSIIIPTRDRIEHLKTCVESIRRKTTYPDYEIIIVDNQSSEKEALDLLEALNDESRISVIRYEEEFNFSLINNHAARHANGDFLVFLNNDTEIIDGGWLEAMLEVMQFPHVGIAGAKLLYPDNTIQHAGIALWHCGTAGHLLSRLPADDHGYFGMADTIRNCSAVSAACMMIKKEVFDKIDGFDEAYAVSYQDVDLCLRAREAGYRVVFTPFAALYHHESASTGTRADEREERLFRANWAEKVPTDRYYNSNFPTDNVDFRL
jgi:GT2 family glycosyltransferase